MTGLDDTPGSAPADAANLEESAQTAIDFADACLAYTGSGAGDERHRSMLVGVASGALSAGEAIRQTVSRRGVRVAGETEQSSFTIADFDDYLIDGAFTLRNRLVAPGHSFGIDDPQLFRELEVQISRIRLVELWLDPVVPTFEYGHLKEIHRRIFSDIYQWAGSERVGPRSSVIRFAPDAVDFAAGDPAAPLTKYSYYPGAEVADAMALQCAQLSRILADPDMTREELIDRVAEHGSDIQTIHPFRDGNFRACFVFIAQYCHAAGFPVDALASPSGSNNPQKLAHAVYRYAATSEHDDVATGLGEILTRDRVERPTLRPQ